MSRRGPRVWSPSTWLVCLAVLIGVPTSASAEPVVLGTQSASTGLAAYGEYVAWSQGDLVPNREAPYRLVVSRAGAAPVVMPIAPRSVPFDVDLGPDAAGRAVAVYSRCRVEPRRGGSFREVSSGLPLYAFGRGCDLYQLDLATGRERALRFGTSRRRSETLPSVWRGEIAYAATDPDFDAGRSRPQVFRRRLRPGSRETRISRVAAKSRAGYPVGVDLRGERLALLWDRDASRCGDAGADDRYDPVISELWLYSGAGRSRVGRGCDTDPTIRFSTASLDAGRLVYLQDLQTGEVAVSLSLVTWRKTSTPLPECTSAARPSLGSLAFVRAVSCADATLGKPPVVEVGRL